MRFHKAESAFFVFIFVILAAGLVTFHSHGQLQDIATDLDAASRVDKIVYLNKLLFVTGALLATALFFGTFFIYPLIRGQVREEGKLRAMTVSLSARSQTLEQAALTDGLTGMQNRRYFDERLSSSLARGRRSHAPMALLYLDIDRFKSINDGHGHAAGDQVLREFARRLKSCVREGDLVARIGGDEFVVLVEGADSRASAEAIAAKLTQRMQEPFDLPNGPLAVGTSIGLGYSRASANADRLLAAADQALYGAKQAGRGTWRTVELD